MLTPRAGFTIVEVIVALVVLSAAVLGLAGSATTLTIAAASAEVRAEALYATQDMISRIRSDPDYENLDDWEGTESDTPSDGFTRTTDVTRVVVTNPNPLDYTVITVVVDGERLTDPIERTMIVAAP